MRPFHPRRPALVSATVGMFLVAGLLSFAPAQAATAVVSGTVVDTARVPVTYADIQVWVKDEDEGAFFQEPVEASTDRRGRFHLDLDPGTYRLRVVGDQRHVPEFYNNATRLRDATSIVVGDSAVELDTIELELRPTVKGTVTSSAGGAVPSGIVAAFVDDPDFGWDAVSWAEVESDGSFALPVDPGTYRIGFGDEEDAFVEEYWEDAPSIEGAKDVSVGPAGVEGVNAVLSPRAVVPPTVGTVENWVMPRVEGYPAVGRTVWTGDGKWAPAATVTRQWLRNGVPIPGATGASYLVTPADLGTRLSVRLTGSAPSMNPGVRSTDSVGPVRWHTDLTATSRPGRAKSTVTVRIATQGPAARGTVRFRLRGKVVKTAAVRNGRAVVKLKRPSRSSAWYDVQFTGDSTVYGARSSVKVTFRKAKKK